MGSVWQSTQKGERSYVSSDNCTGCRQRGAAVRAALRKPCRRDAQRGHSGGHPDARQAAAGGRAVGVCQHGGRGISDPGDRGLYGAAGAQRLLCTGISCPAHPARRSAAPGICRSAAGSSRAARPVRSVHPGRGPGAVPVPHLGPTAERAALFLAPAADPWRCAGGRGAAAGAGGLSGGIPGRAVHR